MAIHRQLTIGIIGTNCYVVGDENTRLCAVIDPGDEASRVLELLKNEKLSAEYIFLTHGHFDHVLGVHELKKATGARVVLHALDAPMLKGMLPDILSEEGSAFTLGDTSFLWLHTPGHSPGSCCILCGRALYSGDTLFEDDCGRCDLPGGDYRQMLRSLRRLAALDGDYTVYPGHDVSTTLSRERHMNVNMREALST